MLNSISKLLLTTMIGVIFGWLFHSMISVDTELTIEPVGLVQEQGPEAISEERTISGSRQLENDIGVSETANADIVNNEPLANVESILDYLSKAGGDSQPHGESSYQAREVIRQLLKDSPELGFELLEALLDIEDQDLKRQLTLTLATIDSGKENTLEPWLVARIENGERPGEWLALLGEWGLRTRSGFDSVLKQLANNPDPDVVSSSIKALSTTLNTHPLAMSPNQKEDLSNQLKQLFSASNDDVRQAAITSLASFPQDDMQQLLLNAFNDSSSKVRAAALMSYMRQPTPSPDIQNLVINQLQDKSRSYKERSSLASLALTLDLSDYQRTLVQNVQSEAEENFLSLTKEEQLAISQNFDDY